MLSIEEVRALIEDSENYSDKEIEEIRDDVRILAEIALESYVKETKKAAQ